MLKIIIVNIIFLVAIFFSCSPQKALEQVSSDSQKIANKDFIFPDDWMGYWKGDLEIYKENKLVRTLPMALDHAFTDTVGYYKWGIIYGPDSIAGRRDYYLNTVDAEKGHYQTDEQNSIFLDSYLFGNQLAAQYNVESITIQSNYTLIGEELHFEILAIGKDPVSITGDKIVKGDTIPKVVSFPIQTKQKAILRKVR